MNDFKPNAIELSVWGDSTAIENGHKRGRAKFAKRKVACTTCFKAGMTAQQFANHRKQNEKCKNARGEM